MQKEIELLPKQHAFFESQARFPALVTGWGYGKTMTLLLKGIAASQAYPNNLGLIIRNDFVDLQTSTMKDFTDITGLAINSNKEVKLSNGSVIMFGHGSELAKLQNINLGWAALEQAEEFDTDEQFELLRGRIRRNGVPHWIGISANTKGHNWIWRKWRCGTDADYQLFEATSFDNPHLPADTIADFRKLEKESPHHYNRFVMNSWEDLDISDKVIPYNTIRDAINYRLIELRHRKVIGVDPAEMGDDETAIYVFDNGKVIDSRFHCHKETMETAGWIAKLANSHGRPLIAVDNIGIGSGVLSRLKELGYNAIAADSRRVSNIPERYTNIKAEMWWNAREMFENKLVSIPNDPVLIEELGVISYTLTSKGQTKLVDIDDKKKMVKLLGRSPNRADALVIGLWALGHVGYETDYYDDDSECVNLAESYV